MSCIPVRVTTLAFAAVTSLSFRANAQVEKVDQPAMQRIRDEGFNHSQVMETASWLTDIYGPRLTGSPNAKKAGDWTIQAMKAWGISNPRYEIWGNFGHGWANDGVLAQVVAPQVYPVIAYPTPWSFGTNGVARGEAVIVRIDSVADFEKYRGKLRGKWVLSRAPIGALPRFTADACRFDDAQLAGMVQTSTELSCASPAGPQIVRADSLNRVRAAALAAGQGGRGGAGGGRGAGGRGGAGGPTLAAQIQQFYLDEGVLGGLGVGSGTDGTITVGGGRAPATIPEKGIAALNLIPEHYGRIYRTIEKGISVVFEANVVNRFLPDTGSFNIVGEIPGTDSRLKDEVVMLGAHFDSWAAGTGATDNAAGSAIMLEAMRILKTLNLPMKRTVRIGLWTGEEQGLIGSRAYVRQHFGFVDSTGQHFTPEWSKLAAYFNVDNGTGAIRGIYAEHNTATEAIFKQWLAPFADLGATTVTMAPTTGTDHQSFDAIGLAGFQFVQDEIDYSRRTHHTNMDLYERLVPHDLMQNAVIVAAFVYDAANRDEMLPRKVAPSGAGRGR